MASKGPKPPVKPAASKPAGRAGKVKIPGIAADAALPEKPVPAAAPETIVPFASPEPAMPTVPQELIEVASSAAEPAPADAAPVVNEAAALGEQAGESIVKEVSTMETVIENNATKAQAAFGDFNERARAAMEKSTKLVEEANEFAKGNIEALVESGRIAAKGFESLGQDAADYGRRSFENATTTMKTLASVKSPTEFFKLHSDFVRGAFDSYVAEASKHTEAMLKLAGDAAQPLSNRFAVAMDKVKTVA